jgi:hypothetical protein
MLKINVLKITFFLFSYATVFGQTSKEILTSYIERSFNHKLKDVSVILMRGKYITSLPRQNELNPVRRFTEYSKPNGVRKNEIITDNNTTVICFDGKEEIVTRNGKLIILPDLRIKNDTYDTTLEAKKSPKYEFINYLADAWLENEGEKFELVGKEVINKHECFILKSTTYIKEKEIYYYIDVVSFLPLSAKFIDKLVDSVSDIEFEDYKVVDGLIFPFKKKIYSYNFNNKDRRFFTGIQYEEIIINPKIDDSIFDCSKLTKPIIKE